MWQEDGEQKEQRLNTGDREASESLRNRPGQSLASHADVPASRCLISSTRYRVAGRWRMPGPLCRFQQRSCFQLVQGQDPPLSTSTSHRRCANGSAMGSSLRLQAARMVLPFCVFRNMPARENSTCHHQRKQLALYGCASSDGSSTVSARPTTLHRHARAKGSIACPGPVLQSSFCTNVHAETEAYTRIAGKR